MQDATYYRTRAANHLLLAARSTHPQARAIHFEFAHLYEARRREALGVGEALTSRSPRLT